MEEEKIYNFKGVTATTIPSECYTITINSPNNERYTVYYDNKRINDVFGLIRYGHNDDYEEPKIFNWQEKFGD